MKIKVTEQGVTIPKELLLGVEEVEISQDNHVILIKRIMPNEDILENLDREKSESETIGRSLLNLANKFIEDLTSEEIQQLPHDGAEQHDYYLYGSPKKTR